MFDFSNEYEIYIAPIAERLNHACAMHGIPYFCSICVKDDGEKTVYQNSMHGSVSQGIVLTDDQILKHINVANGFDTILKKTQIDFEEFDEMDDE